MEQETKPVPETKPVRFQGTPIDIAGTVYIVPMLVFKECKRLAANIDNVHTREHKVAQSVAAIKQGDMSATVSVVKELTDNYMSNMENDLPIALAALKLNYPDIADDFLESNADADTISAMVSAAIVRNKVRTRSTSGETKPANGLAIPPSQLTGTISQAELSQLPDGALKQ